MTGIAPSTVVRSIDVDTYRDVRLRLYDIPVLCRTHSLSQARSVILLAGTGSLVIVYRSSINKPPSSRYESEKYAYYVAAIAAFAQSPD